jgi:hypothetical protein
MGNATSHTIFYILLTEVALRYKKKAILPKLKLQKNVEK